MEGKRKGKSGRKEGKERVFFRIRPEAGTHIKAPRQGKKRQTACVLPPAFVNLRLDI